MVTIINEIFELPPNIWPFGYVNLLYELALGYSNYVTEKKKHLGEMSKFYKEIS